MTDSQYCYVWYRGSISGSQTVLLGSDHNKVMQRCFLQWITTITRVPYEPPPPPPGPPSCQTPENKGGGGGFRYVPDFSLFLHRSFSDRSKTRGVFRKGGGGSVWNSNDRSTTKTLILWSKFITTTKTLLENRPGPLQRGLGACLGKRGLGVDDLTRSGKGNTIIMIPIPIH